MKPFSFLAPLVLLTVPALADQGRPNILMIAVDDLNDWVGAFGGHPQVKTPHLDRLARTSMVFRNASCPGPVCGPSRSALLSGFRPSTTGAYSNSTNMLRSPIVQTHATLPEYFSKHGYTTISSGKIFHKHATESGMDHGQWAYDVWQQERGGGGRKPESVYSRNEGILAGRRMENARHREGGGTEFSWGVTEQGKEATLDYRTAKWFEQQLQAQHDRPFFMLAGISKPHLPWFVPQEYYDLYDLATLQVPELRLDDLADIVDAQGRPVFKPSTDFLWVQEYGLQQRAVQAYLAAISYADACIGVMLDALRNSRHADNTIVIVWGDHGWHLGEKLRYRKATLWRESTQLPLMVSLPGMKERQDCYRNVNLLDLYPSLIELCGLPPKNLDGKSFKPLLANPELPWTPTVTTLGRGNHSVMSEKWHYIQYDDGVTELYDLGKDPLEWDNLARVPSPEFQRVQAHLRTFLPAQEVEGLSQTSNKANSRNTVDPTIKQRRHPANLR